MPKCEEMERNNWFSQSDFVQQTHPDRKILLESRPGRLHIAAVRLFLEIFRGGFLVFASEIFLDNPGLHRPLLLGEEEYTTTTLLSTHKFC